MWAVGHVTKMRCTLITGNLLCAGQTYSTQIITYLTWFVTYLATIFTCLLTWKNFPPFQSLKWNVCWRRPRIPTWIEPSCNFLRRREKPLPTCSLIWPDCFNSVFFAALINQEKALLQTQSSEMHSLLCTLSMPRPLDLWGKGWHLGRFLCFSLFQQTVWNI